MSQVGRLIAGLGVMISMVVLGILYVRAALPLMARCSGPFCGPVDLLRVIVPTIIGGVLLATAAWIIFGPVQRERSRTVERRRR